MNVQPRILVAVVLDSFILVIGACLDSSSAHASSSDGTCDNVCRMRQVFIFNCDTSQCRSYVRPTCVWCGAGWNSRCVIKTSDYIFSPGNCLPGSAENAYTVYDNCPNSCNCTRIYVVEATQGGNIGAFVPDSPQWTCQ